MSMGCDGPLKLPNKERLDVFVAGLQSVAVSIEERCR